MDFRLSGNNSYSPKDLFWSHKKNGVGLRFMAIVDGKSKVRFLSNGYSPKVYDGHWLEINKHIIEEKLLGSTIIADKYFEKGANQFSNCDFITPVPEPRGTKRRNDDSLVSQLN